MCFAESSVSVEIEEGDLVTEDFTCMDCNSSFRGIGKKVKMPFVHVKECEEGLGSLLLIIAIKALHPCSAPETHEVKRDIRKAKPLELCRKQNRAFPVNGSSHPA